MPANTNTPFVATVSVLPEAIEPLVQVITPAMIPLVPASVAPASRALELVTSPLSVKVPLLNKLVPSPVSWLPLLAA